MCYPNSSEFELFELIRLSKSYCNGQLWVTEFIIYEKAFIAGVLNTDKCVEKQGSSRVFYRQLEAAGSW